jgi:hypothetical protein
MREWIGTKQTLVAEVDGTIGMEATLGLDDTVAGAMVYTWLR